MYEYPPGNLILRMGFRSLRELLDNMDEREILTLASFTEDKDYFDRIFTGSRIILDRIVLKK